MNVDPDSADAAQQAAQQAANRQLNETISHLPKFYSTAKDPSLQITSSNASTPQWML